MVGINTSNCVIYVTFV